MKKFLFLFWLVVGIAGEGSAALVRNYFTTTTNSAVIDTNYLIITKVTTNILANGGVIPTGIPVRTTRAPATNSLAQGFYEVRSPLTRGSYVINIDFEDNGSTVYDYTNYLHSGYNTYVSRSITSNEVVTALGFVPGTGTGSGTNGTTYTNNATLAAGQISGSGIGTNIIGTLTNNTTGSSAYAGTATNTIGTLNPLMFGAIMDGVTDDWQAWSNTFVAANNTNLYKAVVISLLGKEMLISKAPQPIRRANVTVENGVIYYGSTNNGFVIGADSAYAPDNLTIQRLRIIRTDLGVKPDTNCVGVNLAADFPAVDGVYWANFHLQDCDIYGFHRNLVCGGNTQSRIFNNRFVGAWSNCVYYAPFTVQPDMAEIAYNGFGLDDAPGAPIGTDFQRTNVIAIQVDSGNLGLSIHHNNMTKFKQVLKLNPLRAYSLNFSWNEVQGLFTANSNITPVEVWNTAPLVMERNGILPYVGSFGSSNYVATYGIYATNGSHLNFSASKIMRQDYNTYDIWSDDGLANPIDGHGFPLFYGAGNVRVHDTWGDVGTVHTFTDVNAPALTAWYQGTNQQFSILNTLRLGNGLIDLVSSGSAVNFVNGQANFSQFTTMTDLIMSGGIYDVGTNALQLNSRYGDQILLKTGTGGSGVTRATLSSTGLVSTVPFYGNGAGVTNLNASSLASGTVDNARLDSDLSSWATVTRAVGFDTFAATATSQSLASLLTDETGSGSVVLSNAPTTYGLKDKDKLIVSPTGNSYATDSGIAETGPGLYIARSISSGTQNEHGIIDRSSFNLPGLAYAAFDSQASFPNNASNYNHYAGFQQRGSFNGSGTLGNYYSFSSMPVVSHASGTITTLYHFGNPVANTVDGAIGTEYGLYIKPLNGVVKWGVYIVTNSSFFGGPIISLSQTNSANIQSATLNLTGNGYVAGDLTLAAASQLIMRTGVSISSPGTDRALILGDRLELGADASYKISGYNNAAVGLEINGTLTVTNGVVRINTSTFPTNSVPSGNSNTLDIVYKAIPYTVRTNIGTAGSFQFFNTSNRTWEAFVP